MKRFFSEGGGRNNAYDLAGAAKVPEAEGAGGAIMRDAMPSRRLTKLTRPVAAWDGRHFALRGVQPLSPLVPGGDWLAAAPTGPLPGVPYL